MFYSDNLFVGEIPTDWEEIANLERLTVLNNPLDLESEIPEGLCILRLSRLEQFEAPCELCLEAGSIGTVPCCTNIC